MGYGPDGAGYKSQGFAPDAHYTAVKSARRRCSQVPMPPFDLLGLIDANTLTPHASQALVPCSDPSGNGTAVVYSYRLPLSGLTNHALPPGR